MTTQEQVELHILGAWNGAVGDPQRVFQGILQDAGPGPLEAGSRVQVTFETEASRTPDVKEHGKYVLCLGQQRWSLMRLTCQQIPATGKEGQDDTQEALWTAILLPTTPDK